MNLPRQVVPPPLLTLEQAEKNALLAAIERYPNESPRGLAHYLGCGKNTVYLMLRRYGIKHIKRSERRGRL